MKLWLIFVQGDDHTWLEAAWDDESTAENHDGWQEEVERIHQMCADNSDLKYEMRVCETVVADVYELFDTPKLRATRAKGVET